MCYNYIRVNQIELINNYILKGEINMKTTTQDARRQELINKLEKLHKEQRGWQRTVNDEVLDYEAIAKIPTDELEKIVENLSK